MKRISYFKMWENLESKRSFLPYWSFFFLNKPFGYYQKCLFESEHEIETGKESDHSKRIWQKKMIIGRKKNLRETGKIKQLAWKEHVVLCSSRCQGG